MAGYYFRLPPITKLTISQQSAMRETKQIALSGGPGTGKSVVSLWRHIINFETNRKSLLLTFTTTLKEYLKAQCSNPNAKMNVKTSLRGKPTSATGLTEVIIDEAQDLPVSYYEGLKRITSKISYGADDSQILYPNQSSKQSDLKKLFPVNTDCVLDKNFRNTKQIIEFTKVAFPDIYIPRGAIPDKNGELPVLLISNGSRYEKTNSKQDSSILQIINSFGGGTDNIAILVPWKSDVDVFENVIKDTINDYSIYYEDSVKFPNGCGEIKNVHITTFKSAKGLEFDIVIIPNFHKYKEICGQFNIEWNDYYVGVTRTRSNLYLISNYDMPEFNSVTDKQIL